MKLIKSIIKFIKFLFKKKNCYKWKINFLPGFGRAGTTV